VKTARNIGIALVLAGVSAWLAHLHVVAQIYHPVVRLASPDGLVFTAVQDAQSERRTCGKANDLFIDPVMQACENCQVVLARCERELHGTELDIQEGRWLHPVVQSPGVRMAIEGPAAIARATCEQIASLMVRNGVRSAACVQPAARS
jgi:hypothetical protein